MYSSLDDVCTVSDTEHHVATVTFRSLYYVKLRQ